MLILRLTFLLLGRFVLGLGVGIAFVSAFVGFSDYCRLLNSTNSSTLQFNGSTSVYLITALYFALGTFLTNLLVFFFTSLSSRQLIILYAAPAFITGLST